MATESVPAEMTDAELKSLIAPQIDDETAQRMEEHAQRVGVSRRLALVALSRGVDTLSEFCVKDPDSFGEMQDSIEDFLVHARAILDVAETAAARMRVADCRQPVPGKAG